MWLLPGWARNPGLAVHPIRPHHTTRAVRELEGLVATFLPSAGMYEGSWGLFTHTHTHTHTELLS